MKNINYRKTGFFEIEKKLKIESVIIYKQYPIKYEGVFKKWGNDIKYCLGC